MTSTCTDISDCIWCQAVGESAPSFTFNVTYHIRETLYESQNSFVSLGLVSHASWLQAERVRVTLSKTRRKETSDRFCTFHAIIINSVSRLPLKLLLLWGCKLMAQVPHEESVLCTYLTPPCGTRKELHCQSCPQWVSYYYNTLHVYRAFHLIHALGKHPSVSLSAHLLGRFYPKSHPVGGVVVEAAASCDCCHSCRIALQPGWRNLHPKPSCDHFLRLWTWARAWPLDFKWHF